MEIDLTLYSNILSLPLDDIFNELSKLTLRKLVQTSLFSKLHGDVILLYLYHHPEKIIRIDKKGKSIFHYASKSNHIELVNALVFLAPCLLFIKDIEGKTPIEHVESYVLRNMLSNHEIVKSYIGLSNVYDKLYSEKARGQKLKKKRTRNIHNATPQSAFMISLPQGGSYINSPQGSIPIENASIGTFIRYPTPFDYEEAVEPSALSNFRKRISRLRYFRRRVPDRQ